MDAWTVSSLILSSWGLLVLAGSILPYLAWHFYLSLFASPRNLKLAYNAKWAVVTGSSTGIGKALAQRCAGQGLDVVLVARPDKFLDATFEELKEAFPEREFRKVAVELGVRGYIDVVAEATKDITCQVCFMNAGYVQTGFFNRVPVAAHYANLECNVGHSIGLTHLFLNRMLEAKARGCFVYTSSAAAVMPGPFVSLYNSTKAFLSAFGSSLAAEVKSHGIDVLVFHPSPVASRFTESADHQIDALDFFNKFAVKPETLPDAMFAAVGRCVWRDSGLIALMFRMTSKLVDYNMLSALTAAFAHTMPDFKRHSAPSS